NGPYQLKVWKHHDEIIAERNPYYWRKDQVLAESVHLSRVDDPMTCLHMFENGQIDVIGNPLCPLPVDALPTLNKQGKLKKKPIAGTTILCFNTEKFPFSNVHIRKAFALAINREEIVKDITQLDEMVATNAIPPLLKGNRYRSFFTDHDTAKAQEFLQIGMDELKISKEDLQNIVYQYSNVDAFGKIAQAIQQQLIKTLGIHVILEGIETKIFMDNLVKRNYSVAQAMWIAQYNDQMNILERFKFRGNAKNYPQWENAEYIELLNKSAFETGETRLATLEKAEEIFLDEMPVAPIYHWEFSYMIQPHLNDFGLSPIGDIYLQDIEVSHPSYQGNPVAKK
ncbi:MAG: peptide ABC transporter substrate-binding protein, partial [Chlamydiales bacterium]|nr:peptide ABC transporter substrate-binding protein [Chlamydiales bacterium]